MNNKNDIELLIKDYESRIYLFELNKIQLEKVLPLLKPFIINKVMDRLSKINMAIINSFTYTDSNGFEALSITVSENESGKGYTPSNKREFINTVCQLHNNGVIENISYINFVNSLGNCFSENDLKAITETFNTNLSKKLNFDKNDDNALLEELQKMIQEELSFLSINNDSLSEEVKNNKFKIVNSELPLCSMYIKDYNYENLYTSSSISL